MSKTPDDGEKKIKKFHIGRTILRFVVFLIISLIIGTTVFKWNARTLTKNSLPMPFGFATAVVLSGSMEPTLNVNDLIVVKSCDTYSVGDIVVYQDRESSTGMANVTHRIIIDNKDGTFVTQGDNNNSPDTPIGLSDIKGKVIFHIPGVGNALEIVKSPAVIVAVIVVAIILLSRSYKKEKKSGLDEMDEIRQEIDRLKAEKEALEKDSSEKPAEEPEKTDKSEE